jgi:hypothetical protein
MLRSGEIARVTGIPQMTLNTWVRLEVLKPECPCHDGNGRMYMGMFSAKQALGLAIVGWFHNRQHQEDRARNRRDRRRKKSATIFILRPVMSEVSKLTDEEVELLLGADRDAAHGAAEELLLSKVMNRNSLEVIVHKLGHEAGVQYCIALYRMRDYLKVQWQAMKGQVTNQNGNGTSNGSNRLPVIPRNA